MATPLPRQLSDAVPTRRRVGSSPVPISGSPGPAGHSEVIVVARGELDLHTADPLREKLRAAVGSPATRVVADFCDVDFVDSTALGLLTGTHKQLAAGGRVLVVRTCRPRILSLLRLTGLHRVLTVDSESCTH